MLGLLSFKSVWTSTLPRPFLLDRKEVGYMIIRTVAGDNSEGNADRVQGLGHRLRSSQAQTLSRRTPPARRGS